MAKSELGVCGGVRGEGEREAMRVADDMWGWFVGLRQEGSGRNEGRRLKEKMPTASPLYAAHVSVYGTRIV